MYDAEPGIRAEVVLATASASADGSAVAYACVMSGERDAAAVVAQWQDAGATLADARRRELREMTDEQALAAAEQLLDLARHLPLKSTGSGLVEQQRLFARAR